MRSPEGCRGPQPWGSGVELPTNGQTLNKGLSGIFTGCLAVSNQTRNQGTSLRVVREWSQCLEWIKALVRPNENHVKCSKWRHYSDPMSSLSGSKYVWRKKTPCDHETNLKDFVLKMCHTHTHTPHGQTDRQTDRQTDTHTHTHTHTHFYCTLSVCCRCSQDDDQTTLPLFEALDSLTWPRRLHHGLPHHPRASSPRSISSTGAVINLITNASGPKEGELQDTDHNEDSHVISRRMDDQVNPEYRIMTRAMSTPPQTVLEVQAEREPRILSRSSAPNSMPQSPDLIMCSDRSSRKKAYVPHLPHTQTTFKPVLNQGKQQQQQQWLAHRPHGQNRHRTDRKVPKPSTELTLVKESESEHNNPVSGSDPEDPEPDLPSPMAATSISRLSPMITSGSSRRLHSPKRQSFASLYGNKKTDPYHKERSLSPLSETGAASPRQKGGADPTEVAPPQSPSAMPAPSWSSQVDEAFRRLQLTKQADVDVVKTSIV